MKINSGHMIRKMRNDMGINQEEMAGKLHMSTRQLSRVERGDADMDIWQFMTVLELLGQPSEDVWLLYLDSDEYEEYKVYRNLKRLLRERRYDEAKDSISELEKKGLSKRPFISQFMALAKVQADAGLPPEEALNKLYEAMRMSLPDFDESKVSEYRMTYNEMYIVGEMAVKLSKTGEMYRAINLYEAMIASRENMKASEEDKASLLPAAMFNLSTILGKVGKLKAALKLCNQAIELCKEYNNLRYIPGLLYNIASCYHSLGEEEQIYKPYLIRAYHCAYAIGNFDNAKIIKKDAEESFGILIT